MSLISIGEALWNARREEVTEAIATGDYDGAIRIIDELEQTSRLNRQQLPKGAEVYSGLAHMLQIARTAEDEGRQELAEQINKVFQKTAEKIGAEYNG